MIPVIIYGPPASGKTRHAEALRDYFGLSFIVDEWPATYPPVQNTLYLTTVDVPPLAKTLPVCTILHINEALAYLEASNALRP